MGARKVMARMRHDRMLSDLSERLRRAVDRVRSTGLVQLVSGKLNYAASELRQAERCRKDGQSDADVAQHLRRAEIAIEEVERLV